MGPLGVELRKSPSHPSADFCVLQKICPFETLDFFEFSLHRRYTFWDFYFLQRMQATFSILVVPKSIPRNSDTSHKLMTSISRIF